MKHELPDLPYDYCALQPHLNGEALRIHHDRHHGGYVNALNQAEDKVRRAQRAGDFRGIRDLCEAAAFYHSAHVLHSIYWTNMSPNGSADPGGALADSIDRDLNGLSSLKTHFVAAANTVRGSGWGVLAWQPIGGQLVVLQSEAHQNLAQWGVVPILVLDVWEHAYYGQYQNRRTEYTARFVDVINWGDVADRFAAAKQTAPIRILPAVA